MRLPHYLSILALAALLPMPLMAEVEFASDFESGCGINFNQVTEDLYSFELPPDTESTDRQWFYFRINGAKDRTLTFRLLETDKTNVTSHWDFARPVASSDGGETWERVNGHTNHDREENTFDFSHTITSNSQLIAYHFPYTYTTYQQKLEEWKQHPDVSHHVIGQSVQGRPIDLLQIGRGNSSEEKKGFWVVARQHAAETTGSFTAEGFMDFVLSQEPEAQALRQNAHLVFVPMMNPDGVVGGNYRNNIAGINLNRVWDSANQETSPETLSVQKALEKWLAAEMPFDFFIDFHSDSGAREHFAFHAGPGAEAPLYPEPEKYNEDTNRFLDLVAEGSPDFQPRKGASSSENQGLSYHYMRLNHGVLAMIPEGPYGDINFGENQGTWITEDRHRAVGVAFARALQSFYNLPLPEDADPLEAWIAQ